MSQERDIVTGEAVVLDLRPASFVTRGLAIIADLVVLVVLVLGVTWLLVSVADLDDAAGAAITLVSLLGVLIGVPTLVETLTRGRSLGKWMAGLRVVRDDGGPIRARHALIRALLAVLEIYWTSGTVAIIASIVNGRGKRLGDMLAGTYVIRERAPSTPYVSLSMPSGLAGWASGADLGRIPDGLALAARQYIGRSRSLSPEARLRLGADLVRQVGRYVAPAPPHGHATEDVLMAVLVERRRRDHDRLARQATARDARERRRRESSVLTEAGTSFGNDVS